MTPAATPDPLRYPIGRPDLVATATPEQRIQWTGDLAALPDQIAQAVAGLSDAQLDTPYRPGGWTVRQVVHHLADSHMQAYSRIRFALTEQPFTIKPYDEAAWAELPDAKLLPVTPSLQMLSGAHERLVVLLRALTPEQWALTMFHPERGPMTLDMMLGLYSWHGRHHLAHIQHAPR